MSGAVGCAGRDVSSVQGVHAGHASERSLQKPAISRKTFLSNQNRTGLTTLPTSSSALKLPLSTRSISGILTCPNPLPFVVSLSSNAEGAAKGRELCGGATGRSVEEGLGPVAYERREGVSERRRTEERRECIACGLWGRGRRESSERVGVLSGCCVGSRGCFCSSASCQDSLRAS